MSGASDFSEPFSVTCPRCDCRFQPPVRLTFYFAKCPDCSEPVRVPAAAEVEDENQTADGGLPSAGDTYRIARPVGWEDSPEEISFAPYPVEPQTTGKVREEKKPRPPQQPEKTPPEKADPSHPPGSEEGSPSAPATSSANCPACGANFQTTPSEEPQVVLCPECLEDVHVPAGSNLPPARADETSGKSADPEAAEDPVKPEIQQSEESETFSLAWETPLAEPTESAEASPKRQKKRRKKPSTEAAGESAKNPSRREKSAKNVFDTMAEIREVGEDSPPKWTFFSGVTDFLIRPEVAIRWVYASVGVCFMGWLCALVAHFYDSFPIALPFVLLPLFWIGLMTLSYAAANSMAILLETAGGNDKVEAWPDPVMKEQAVDLVYLSFLLIVAEVMSFFLGQMLSVLIGPAWLVSLALLFLLYPIVLLSSLEANTPFIPLTLPILNSLKTLTWAWGVFYGLSFGLMMIWVVPLVWSFRESGGTMFVSMIFLAPLISGWCFLYARLLGRVAWRVSLEFPEEEDEAASKKGPAKTRKKKPGPKEKPSVSESSGELQAAR